jgi:hypothetical protein
VEVVDEHWEKINRPIAEGCFGRGLFEAFFVHFIRCGTSDQTS